jgi:hypothetical protein
MHSDLLHPLTRADLIREWRAAAQAAHVAECALLRAHVLRHHGGAAIDPELKRNAVRLRANAERLRQQFP